MALSAEATDALIELSTRLDFERPRFAVGEVQDKLGVPAATLRNWLTRQQLDLGANRDRSKGTWREFSIRDVLVIATAFQLSRIGVPVATFSGVATFVADFVQAAHFSGNVVTLAYPTIILSNGGMGWEVTLSVDSSFDSLSDVNMPYAAIVLDVRSAVAATFAAVGAVLPTAKPGDEIAL